jgi:predicted dienelactone hydrolase
VRLMPAAGALLLAILLGLTQTVHAEEQTLVLAGLKVALWAPEQTPAAKAPLIVFSHGFHGCATQSRFLMTALAGAGYLVVAPNHRDATCDGGPARWRDRPESSFVDPAAWTAASFRDRADDISRLLAALRADPRWRDRIDWTEIGLVGHSLGGYTVLGLAGAWPEWNLPGIKAVLALSPYSQPFVHAHTMERLAVPVMLQGGTRDFGITPTLHRQNGAFDQAPAPKYDVEFAGAGHFAWTDVSRVAHAAIIAYSIAFLDHYVRGLPAESRLTQPSSEVALLRFASELGTGGDGASGRRLKPVENQPEPR